MISSGPQYGQLFLDGQPLTADSTFTQADIDANRLSYQNDSGAVSGDLFEFTLTDTRGNQLTGTFAIEIRSQV